MALALKDRVKETTIVVGTGSATLLGSSIGFQPFSVVGNGNTTYYCISDQFGSNWEVGIGTYSSSGNTLDRTTVLASSNGGALVVFTAGVKDVFVTYPAEKGVWLDASNNAIGLGTPAAFVGTNITGTASGLTAGNVTTNANLSGAVSSIGNSTSLGSFTSAQLALAISDETGTGKAVFATNPTLTSPTYAGTLTGSTDILNIGSGQIYKNASGNVGIGTSSPAKKLDVLGEAQISFNSINTYLYYQSTNNYTGRNTDGNMWMNVAAAYSNVFGVAGVEKMRIDSSGNLLVNSTSPIAGFNNQISSTGDSTNRGCLVLGRKTAATSGVCGTITSFNGSNAVCGIDFQSNGANNSGYIQTYTYSAGTFISGPYLNTGGVGWTNSSDETLKDIIEPIENGLSKLSNLRTVIGKFKTDHDDVRRIFLIAQDVQKVLPEAVSKDANGKLGLNYQDLIPLLVASIKELKAIIDTQQEQINSLLGK